MPEILTYLVMTLVGGVAAWGGQKVLTKREKKASDLELIEKAISPMLNSITNLTNHLDEVTAKYAAEQRKNLKLIKEKGELLLRIASLEKEVQKLTEMVKNLSNNEKSTITPCV